MATPIPISSACHTVQLPPVEKDDRLNLNVRTGSASVLTNSLVFVHGGVIVGLELADKLDIPEIALIFTRKVANNKVKRFDRYLSGELFFLDLIARVWTRVEIPELAPKPEPRFFHELAVGHNCIYLFGGLRLAACSDDAFTLAPCNDLWEFNFISRSWVLLHDGLGWHTDLLVPVPRYSHKVTELNHLSFAKKPNHPGLMLAGGFDRDSRPLYQNCIFDLVAKQYVPAGPPLRYPEVKVNGQPVPHFRSDNPDNYVNINYIHSVLLTFSEEAEYTAREQPAPDSNAASASATPLTTRRTTDNDHLFIYAPTETLDSDTVLIPLLLAKLGRTIHNPKLPPVFKKRNLKSREFTKHLLQRTVPYNLRYPTGGVFGQNLVIIGFLPNDYDISIFVYNKPTGKWSRMNIFCNHDYGSHRFWGGFVWRSHHKVVLLGNFVTSHTTSSVRYFSCLVTVSLPVTNILASMEMAGEGVISPFKERLSGTENSSCSDAETSTSSEDLSTAFTHLSEKDEPVAHIRRFSNISAVSDSIKSTLLNKANFNDYVHYAAPKVKFTKVRSMLPPAAITLGRNAFDRYGNTISDFEFISANGDRIPVCLSILMERWGKYFIDILSKAYVRAVDQFEHNQIQNDLHQKLRLSKSSTSSSNEGSRSSKIRFLSNDSLIHSNPPRESNKILLSKEAPQFRLPFQDKSPSPTYVPHDLGSVDPHKLWPERAKLTTANNIISTLREIPAQLPLSPEPIPDVPATPASYRSSSRKNSSDPLSPRASMLHTLSVLRSIPAYPSPSSLPFQSPRGSISLNRNESLLAGNSNRSQKNFDSELARSNKDESDLSSGASSASRRLLLDSESKDPSAQNNAFPSDMRLEPEVNPEGLLNFHDVNPETFLLEPSLIPRKLYIPFETNSLKAFAEFLYTGQVGNKWPLRPCALDCLLMARYFKVPLLYDLLCEVLYGIIGRKEALVLSEGKEYKKKFDDLFEVYKSPAKANFKFPLDEFEGFLDTVDDGYMDIALLRKLSNFHKLSISTRSSKRNSSLSLHHGLDDQGVDHSVTSKEASCEPKESGESSTDDVSASDEDVPALHFLDPQKVDLASTMKSKSLLDKTIYDGIGQQHTFDDDDVSFDEAANALGTTLEMLVSPDYPVPSDHVIDLIYEMASICTDVKLMLRSMNARKMSLALTQTKLDYQMMESRLAKNLETVDEIRRPDSGRQSLLDTLQREKPPLAKSRSAPLSATVSQTSVISGEEHVPMDLNRKFDKHIAQMIKQDERYKKAEKNKADKERQQMTKKEKKPKAQREKAPLERNLFRSPTAPHLTEKETGSDAASIASSKSGERKNRPLFGMMTPKHKRTDKVKPLTDLLRTQSSVSLASQDSEKSNGTRSGVKGFFRRIR